MDITKAEIMAIITVKMVMTVIKIIILVVIVNVTVIQIINFIKRKACSCNRTSLSLLTVNF
ncbi:hypothetical protein [Priestia aryabhattai]|uniref:hypothetical protein n=1 Tax=Priestia aryabhattai TaxID=412384 RepID=UPI0012D3ABB2|nr:hypothetical protein [Priestia aryabhattai]